MIVSTKNTPVVELMSLALGRRRESLICSGEDGGDEADQADRADRPDFGKPIVSYPVLQPKKEIQSHATFHFGVARTPGKN